MMLKPYKAKILYAFAFIAVLTAAFLIHMRSESRQKRTDSITRMSIWLMTQEVLNYKKGCGNYPTEAEGLSVLAHPPNTCSLSLPLMQHQLKDGWGHDLHYKLKGANDFQIISYGRDDLPGGSGPDGDMTSDDFPTH
jgi:general secretion pathway protein G